MRGIIFDALARHAFVLLALFAFNSFGLVSTTASATSIFMMPQLKSSQGPWFEGWYVRVTDVTNHRSFATITTSSTHERVRLNQNSVLPGYIAFIYNRDVQSPTKSQEYFPDKTWANSSGTPGEEDSHFVWKADGFGETTDGHVQLRLPSGDEVEVVLGERSPWSSIDSNLGPEGWIGLTNLLPLRWYVDSLGTPVSYRIHLHDTGETLTGQGYAHVEKNWGRVFPKSWMWTEAISSDNTAHLALAGGPVNFGPVGITSYLVGYKSPAVDLEIRPDQYLTSTYRTKIDACTGEFTLNASNATDRLVVHASAPRESFAPVSIPTVNGYVRNGGMESFVSTITVWAYRNGELLETRTFEGAALEFGADAMVCRPALLADAE